MRVLRFFLISIVLLSVVTAVGFFIAREILLLMGMSTLRSSVSRMRNVSANLEPYVRECQKRGGSDLSESIIERIQLKFTTATEYEVEVICRQFLLDPVSIDQVSLPMFVTKVPGSSGLIWQGEPSSITLSVWGRTRTILVENGQVSYTNQPISTGIGSGPVAACQGYGFSCCSLESAQGAGDQITVASDCPRSCFSRCVARPVVLSFASDPFYDPATRVVQIQPGDSLVFSYVVDFGVGTQGEVTISFGDGENQTLPDAEGTVSHTYSCQQARCEFKAQVVATNSLETSSAQTSVSTISVVVTNQPLSQE